MKCHELQPVDKWYQDLEWYCAIDVNECGQG